MPDTIPLPLARWNVMLILLAAFSGCFGGGDDGGAAEATDADTGGPPTNATGPATGSPTPTPATDITASFTVTGTNLTRDANATYSGPAGELAFSAATSGPDVVLYSWDFGDGETGERVEMNHTYDAGNYTVVLTVWDSEGRSDDATARLELEQGPAGDGQNESGGGNETGNETEAPPFIEDPAGDSENAEGDILAVNVSNTETHVRFEVTFDAIQDGATIQSFWLPSVYINDDRYEPYYCLGSGAVWSYSEEEDVEGASVEVDSDTNTWTFEIPFEALTEPPFELFFEARSGEPCFSGGDTLEDRAPDEGTAVYAPS